MEHSRAFYSPSSHSNCSSKLDCRLDCEADIGKLFVVERLEDGTLHARAFYSPASVRPSLFVDSNVRLFSSTWIQQPANYVIDGGCCGFLNR